ADTKCPNEGRGTRPEHHDTLPPTSDSNRPPRATRETRNPPALSVPPAAEKSRGIGFRAAESVRRSGRGGDGEVPPHVRDHESELVRDARREVDPQASPRVVRVSESDMLLGLELQGAIVEPILLAQPLRRRNRNSGSTVD